jgi:hypothetical protein
VRSSLAATSLFTIGLAVALAIVFSVAFGAIAGAWRRRAASWKARARAQRYLAGETAAEALLEDAGYVIVDRQVRTTWRFFCDDDPVDAELRCDLLVEHGGRLLVAEVKTGSAAPRLDTAATRRQLLEYQLAYGASGVVLVDAELASLSVVDFPMPVVEDEASRAGAVVLVPLLVGIGLGAALVSLL